MLLTYDEYLESAKKIMYKFNRYKDNSAALLNNDDVVSTMIYWMARSDETFDETKGKSQDNRRISYAIYGLLMAMKEQKKAVNNCDYVHSNKVECCGYIEDVLVDNKLSLMDRLAYNEVINFLNSLSIDDESIQYFLYHHRDGLSFREIANDTEYSHEAIRQKVRRVMNIVKERYKNE